MPPLIVPPARLEAPAIGELTPRELGGFVDWLRVDVGHFERQARDARTRLARDDPERFAALCDYWERLRRAEGLAPASSSGSRSSHRPATRRTPSTRSA